MAVEIAAEICDKIGSIWFIHKINFPKFSPDVHKNIVMCEGLVKKMDRAGVICVFETKLPVLGKWVRQLFLLLW